MYQCFRLQADENGADVFSVIPFCEIPGEGVAGLEEQYEESWFTVRPDNDSDDLIVTCDDPNIPEDVLEMVSSYVNHTFNKCQLSTIIRTHIIHNGNRLPHYDMVYIAKSEDDVNDFLNQ